MDSTMTVSSTEQFGCEHGNGWWADIEVKFLQWKLKKLCVFICVDCRRVLDKYRKHTLDRCF